MSASASVSVSSSSSPSYSVLAAAALSGAALTWAGLKLRCRLSGRCRGRQAQAMKKGVKVVTVTGAAGQIGYSILFMIASGRLLGADQPIELRLLDLPAMEGVIKGVIMELEDCAYPLLHKVVGTSDYKEAFTNCDIALLVGARPRGPGMDRKDLLKANAAIFEGQGKALNDYASRNVKILVVGNPANTNALITSHFAPSLPRTAFSAMTRLDQNRAKGQLAKKINTTVGDIKNVVVWGNHSNTQYPDVSHASLASGVSVRQAVNDDAFLQGEFIKVVQSRGAAIIDALKKSSAASAANAAVEHVRDWVLGTPEGEYVSMAVASDGSYGVPPGLIFSFPVTCKDGEYSIVQGLNIDEFSQAKLKATTEELIQERKDALGF